MEFDFCDFIRSRRSVRAFKSKKVAPDVINTLLDAGRFAPSRANSQPWRFVVVTDQQQKDRLAEAAYNQKLIASAPLNIVVLGVVDPRKEVPDRTTELVSAGAFGKDVKDFADHVLDDWKHAELKTDAALNSSIAATQIMLAAHGAGLGCCWVKLCQDDKVLTVLDVPEGYYHTGILAIGYPDQEPKEKPRLPLDSLVYHGRFGQKYELKEG